MPDLPAQRIVLNPWDRVRSIGLNRAPELFVGTMGDWIAYGAFGLPFGVGSIPVPTRHTTVNTSRQMDGQDGKTMWSNKNWDVVMASAVDQARNVIVAVMSAQEAPFQTTIGGKMTLAKYNQKGVLQWEKVLKERGSFVTPVYSICTSRSNEIFIADGTTPGNEASVITKFESDGTVLWSIPFSGFLQVNSSLCCDNAGDLYRIDGSQNVVKVHGSDGSPMWSVGGANFATGIEKGIAVDVDDFIYFRTVTGTLNKLRGTDAREEWSVPIEGDPSSQGGVATDGHNVYVEGNAKIVKYNTAGVVVWSKPFPCADGESLLCMACSSKGVHTGTSGFLGVSTARIGCLDFETGKTKWSLPNPDPILSVPYPSVPSDNSIRTMACKPKFGASHIQATGP